MSTQSSGDGRQEILAKAIFVPLRFDAKGKGPVTTEPKSVRVARNVEHHQQQVRDNIAKLTLTATTPADIPPLHVTRQDRDKLAAATESRSTGSSRRMPKAAVPCSRDVKDPAFYPLVLNQEVQAIYDNHLARAKAGGPEQQRSRQPSTSTSSAPRTAPNLGPSILGPKPVFSRSATLPSLQSSVHQPRTQPNPPPPPSQAPSRQVRNASMDLDAHSGGRRQAVEPGMRNRNRRQSMTDTPGVERREGFFPPQRIVGEGAEAMERPRTGGGTEVHPERDPRKRRPA